MVNKIIIMLLLVAMSAVFSGCETMKGIGKDVQTAGEALEKAATKKTKKE